MAQHWSAFVGVTDRQAYALDKMAEANGFTSGRALLMDLGECSSSKLSKMDKPTLRHLVDAAFEKYGKP